VQHVAIPEIEAMRDLRRALARGGLSPINMRSPEGCARVAAFYVIVDLVRLLDEFKRRLEAGERLLIEIAIEATAA
jgi:hypothetical protein